MFIIALQWSWGMVMFSVFLLTGGRGACTGSGAASSLQNLNPATTPQKDPTLVPLYGPWSSTPAPDMFKLVDYEEQIIGECVAGIWQKFYLVLLYILFIFLKLWENVFSKINFK